jgi:hypothetical protein
MCAWRQFHHPTDVADGDAKSGGEFLEPADVEGGGFLGGDHGTRLGRQTGVRPIPGHHGWVSVKFDLRAGGDLRADRPADLTDRHPVAGGEFVEAAVLEGGGLGGRVSGRHRL